MRQIDADALAAILEDMEATACDGTENDGTDGTTRIEYPVPLTTREMLDLIADQPTLAPAPAPAIIKCDMILPKWQYDVMAKEFAKQVAAGGLVLPPWCELLAELPNDGTVQVVAEAAALNTADPETE